MKKMLYCLLLLVLVGCGPSPDEADRNTRMNANLPQLIATVKEKGRLWRIEIVMPYGANNHYVYYFDNSTNTVSINYDVNRGKSRVNQTVVIDGNEYILKPKE